MSPRCAELAKQLRDAFAATDDLAPSEQDVLYRAALDHVRARRPESVGFLGQLPAPTDPASIRDPRLPR